MINTRSERPNHLIIFLVVSLCVFTRVVASVPSSLNLPGLMHLQVVKSGLHVFNWQFDMFVKPS